MTFALTDKSGRIIGAMDTMCFNLVDNTSRSLRTLRRRTRPAAAPRVLADREINVEIPAQRMQDIIKGWNRLK
jgi:hypothetical protein